MTPEGKIKHLVKALLAKYDIRPAKDAGTFSSAAGWYFMPGSSGYGTRGVGDFLGHYHGRFWAVETKAPGKEPTGFQALQIAAIRCSGGAVFVVDSAESLKKFGEWLSR